MLFFFKYALLFFWLLFGLLFFAETEAVLSNNVVVYWLGEKLAVAVGNAEYTPNLF